MIERFRQWLRGWLGVYDDRESSLRSTIVLQGQINHLEGELQFERDWRREFTESLRQKSSVKPVQRYTDYESSQKAVLSEFEGE